VATPVMGLATSTYAVLRGEVNDQYGDTVDLDDAIYTGIPGSVHEVRSTAYTVSDGRPQRIVSLIGRLPPGVGVRIGDRLKDEKTNVIYIIDEIGGFQSAILDTGTRLVLRLVT
jgi:hypothetical protein